jgi:predicted permease
LGRLFTDADALEPGRSVVLSHASWQQRFGADDRVIGRDVTVGERTFRVVGVLPADFTFPAASLFGGAPELTTVAAPLPVDADGGTFQPIVRLEPGVTREQAQLEMDAIGAELARLDPGQADLVPHLNDVRTLLYPVGRPIMQFLLGAAALVLLIGCANLANMLLARGRARERDTALRAALGASRVRVIRPILLEALMLGLAGSALALLATGAVFEALLRQVPAQVYGNAPIGIDGRVATIGLALGVAGALFFAAVPAWRALGFDVRSLMQGRTRAGGANRLGRPMVAGQVALAIVLVFGAVVAARAFVSVLSVPLGFNAENVLTVAFFPGQDVEDRQGFVVDVIDTLRQRSDVVSIGAAGTMPFDNSAYDEGVQAPGSEDYVAGIVHVLPGFFEATGIPLRRGRLLTWDDVRGDAQVAVVSESAARALYGDADPLGRLFDNGRDREFRIVGVVADVRKLIGADVQPAAYAFPGDATRRMTVVIKARTRSETMHVEVRRTIAAMAPGSSVTSAWWRDRIASVTAFRNPRFQTLILTSFAAIALGLTALGIFGVVAFQVVSRSKEMGIRVAIGASPESLVRLMVRQALIPVALGLVVGVVGTWLLAGVAEAQLYDVDANDPLTLIGAAVTVVVAAVIAAWIPARGASRVDPLVSLRAE